MTLRDALLPALRNIRSIPGQLGMRRFVVEVVQTASSGAELGEGAQTPTAATILEANGQSPKVRVLSAREIALGGYDTAMIEIGPITPDFTGGGTSLSTLGPDPAVNNTVRIKVTGGIWPDGALFVRHEVKHDRPFQYRLICKRAS